jgi:RND family efflux transporter MFP subunit
MMMKTGKIISTLIGISFLGTALAFGFWPERPATPKTASRSVPVQVQAITAEITQREVRFSGVTRPARHAVLSFVVPARMDQRPVEVGDQVHKGQVLARLDVREFDHAVSRAQAVTAELAAQLGQAQRDQRRLERLIQNNAAAVQDAERAAARTSALQAALDAARARLEEARRVRSEATLRAPFSGMVTRVSLEPGEWAEPGHPVIELSGDGEIELEVEVPETVIGRLQKGQAVTVRLPFVGGKRISGRVDHVALAALTAGRLFPVLVTLKPTPELRAGLTAELVLTIQTPPKLLVPLAAIINPGASRPSLFVLENNRVREVLVELGAFSNKNVAVTGNLKPGDQVVVTGHTMLSDGKSVEVQS